MRGPASASGIFQMVHHGLWDYDLPCAPNLIDIQVDGKPVKAVAQVSKQGFCYVFRPVRPAEKTGPTSLSGAANPVSISRRLWTRRLARTNSFLHFQALRPLRLRSLDSLAKHECDPADARLSRPPRGHEEQLPKNLPGDKAESDGDDQLHPTTCSRAAISVACGRERRAVARSAVSEDHCSRGFCPASSLNIGMS